jgi:hypothetical protein
VSEFSQSYHLVTNDQEVVAQLLKSIPLRGFVFPPANKWVTFVPEDKQPGELELDDRVVAANSGTLLHFIHAEDHGWEFQIFERNRRLCSYRCEWEWDLEIKDEDVDLDLLRRLSREHGQGTSKEQFEAWLHPRDIDSLIDDYPEERPAELVAASLGLEHLSWISWHYMTVDDAVFIDTPGIVEVS